MSLSAGTRGTPPGGERAKHRLALVGGSLGNLVEW